MDKKQQDIAYFLSFCIEQYKNEKHLSGADATDVLGKYGVLDTHIAEYGGAESHCFRNRCGCYGHKFEDLAFP